MKRKLSSLLKKLCRGDPRSSYERLSEMKEPMIRRDYTTMNVGEESKQYQVPVKFLSKPTLQQLFKLEMEQEDLDKKINGPKRIVNSTDVFDEVLKPAKKKKK